MTTGEKAMALLFDGFTIGQRNDRLNTDHAGYFMVVEAYEESQLPTKDGSNGPWCVVGFDLPQLIDQGFEFMQSYKE